MAAVMSDKLISYKFILKGPPALPSIKPNRSREPITPGQLTGQDQMVERRLIMLKFIIKLLLNFQVQKPCKSLARV